MGFTRVLKAGPIDVAVATGCVEATLSSLNRPSHLKSSLFDLETGHWGSIVVDW